MRVILFGATGMVGQGVLRECLLDDGVTEVLAIGRSPIVRNPIVRNPVERNPADQQPPKLRELVHADPLDYADIEAQLTGYDACFFCLGVSSAGMTEEAYTRITYDYTLAAAQPLARLNPQMTFIYVSGAGTDRTEHGSSMWARVKGRTENALLRLPFKAYTFRPGIIRPMHGIRSKTRAYRLFYLLFAPVLPVLKLLLPNVITTTEQVGRAMLKVARQGAGKRVLETADINFV